MINQRQKLRTFFCALLVTSLLLSTSPVFAETVQDVPVGEPTISSKAEDPLKEYKERAQNQVPMAESVESQDVPEKTSEIETSPTELKETTGESLTPTSESSEEQPEMTNQRIEPQGGIMPLAGKTLREGLPGDPLPYDIDKNFADVLRTIYPAAPNPMTDDFMESLGSLNVNSKNLTSLKGIEYAVNLYLLNCSFNQLNELDVNSNVGLMTLNVNSNNLTSLKGIEHAVNLTQLVCEFNQLSELDISSNTKLFFLNCRYNQLSELDVSSNTGLTNLSCGNNQLSELDVSSNTALTTLSCANNQLSELDVSNNTALTSLNCGSNPLSELDVSSNTALTTLGCVNNQLSELDVSNNTSLKVLDCRINQISDLDVSEHSSLIEFYCSDNQISELNMSGNPLLLFFLCSNNRLSELDISSNTALMQLRCEGNQLGNLDINSNIALYDLHCSSNQLSELDVSSNTALVNLFCLDNLLSKLDISNNTLLTTLDCSSNRISDISSANGLTALTDFNASNQQITIPVPPVSLTDEATVDVLKTTARTGLTATNVDINPAPATILPNASNGDLIDLTGVTRDSLSDKSISFEYASSALQEGASTYTTKLFSGIITFADVSELKNELQVSSNKTKSGEELTWTWTITSLTEKKAEDIKATFTLPNYVNGDITDIVITKGASSVAGDMNHLNGTTSLGNLEQRESIVITFKSVARGDPEWHEAIGRLDWSDTTPSSPHYNESKQPFKILDDEQTDTPKDSLDMGILSVPIYFNFGMQDIDSTLQTYSLHTLNYQSNTNVVTDGFYTRVKDERSSNTGWELTASLSEFVDKSGIGMPNGSGTSLKLHNMSIEKVTNRDTPQEGIDPSPSGTPSTVKTTETLVAGDAAKTVVDAGASEGDGTWQLRMPFTDLSLNVPANAGKKGTVYQAKLTWSLNSTP